MKNKVLLTGASGSVGFEAFQELLRRREHFDIRIFCLDRPVEHKMFKKYQDDVEIIWGDIRNQDDVRKAVVGVDTVIHTAAVIPPLADHDPDLAWRVNVDGTRHVLTAMKKHNPASRLVYTSSVSVYGDRLENSNIRVEDPLRPSIGDAYAGTKIEAEKMIQQSGLKWAIFRLCGILTNSLGIQPLMFHMPLDTALEWCHASDAGYALVESINCEKISGRIFNLGGGALCRVKARQFLQEMFPMFGLAPAVLPEHAFATQNFHSGDYMDGDELDSILGFRRKTLKDYYATVKRQISPLQRFFVHLIPKSIIRAYFERMSEPLKAIRENDRELIERFYGSRKAFDSLIRPR